MEVHVLEYFWDFSLFVIEEVFLDSDGRFYLKNLAIYAQTTLGHGQNLRLPAVNLLQTTLPSSSIICWTEIINNWYWHDIVIFVNTLCKFGFLLKRWTIHLASAHFIKSFFKLDNFFRRRKEKSDELDRELRGRLWVFSLWFIDLTQLIELRGRNFFLFRIIGRWRPDIYQNEKKNILHEFFETKKKVKNLQNEEKT